MNIFELMGVIIGDGYILYNPKNYQYRLEIHGAVGEDEEYFENIKYFIDKLIKKDITKIQIKKHKLGQALRLYLNNKYLIEYMIKDLGLPHGKKTYSITIPKKFLNWKASKHVIRGIFEADGSLYFSRSRITTSKPTYPRLEIKTCSKNLTKQLVDLLKNQGFKVQTIIKEGQPTKIYVSGVEMLEKWVEEIGFTNINTISKLRFWQKYGYYTPRCTLDFRLNMLKNHPN
ncbi:MAG: hypothetical protein AABW46_02535 [Nanoarchaeota archaeon]